MFNSWEQNLNNKQMKWTDKADTIYFMVLLTLVLFAFILFGCTKQQDFSYLNTDRTGCKTFIFMSTRYTWQWDSITTNTIGWPERCCDSAIIWNEKFRDTLQWDPAKCPFPDPTMPEFRREIRYYKQINQTK